MCSPFLLCLSPLLETKCPAQNANRIGIIGTMHHITNAIAPVNNELIEIKLFFWLKFVFVWFVILVVVPCAELVFIGCFIHVFSLVKVNMIMS